FQAEDGIRDFHVTGVQTCALPISPTIKEIQEQCFNNVILVVPQSHFGGADLFSETVQGPPPQARTESTGGFPLRNHVLDDAEGRSEERRVGKEGRSRWSTYHDKRK